ncbi:MAG TPA: pentapeptide repeat-containing protein [Blastocatellia bacterium]|nr:pentapeptide repeat-containing protein [Blastocatellia bacterium]
MAGRESLRGLNLIRADLAEVCMAGVDLTGANLRMADLTRADLTEARLTNSHLSGAILKEASLVGANLVEANMIGVSLQAADLSRADASGADMTGANIEHAHLVGTYLVGAFLNETSLIGADLSGAYVRMAQLAGSNLTGTQLDGADLSQADLSGIHFEGASFHGAKLEGAILSGSYLTGCDLRDADLNGADLSGCDLTGAKLHGIKFSSVKLDDAWAEWVDLSEDATGKNRATLEEAFTDIIGKPMAQILIEGQVSETAWGEIITHLAEFQARATPHADVRLRAIQQGVATAALYLEADSEASIAAYLHEFAGIAGTGSTNLLAKLQESDMAPPGAAPTASAETESPYLDGDMENDPLQLFEDRPVASVPIQVAEGIALGHVAARNGSENGGYADGRLTSRIEALKRAGFWSSEKGFAIVTGERRVWLEAVSSDSLTLRPPHGVVSGIDLVGGRFIPENSKNR